MATQTERAEELALEFEEANGNLIDVVQRIPQDRWGNGCKAEQGWTVGLTAHHVAYDYPILVDLLGAMTRGEAQPVTMDMLHQINAEHAEKYSDCTQEETLEMLRQEGDRVAEAIRKLDEDDLRQTATIPFISNEPVSVDYFVKGFLIGHIGMHLPSIKETAGV